MTDNQPARVKVLRLARTLVPARARSMVRSVAGRRYIEAQRATLQPVLTVVIPVYNVAEYLPECLDSALGQTLYNLEVIAVDDGSTDGCLEILRAYEAKDARVRVLQQTNSGQGIARNLGVTHARGEFLTFLDSDDTVPAQAYDLMVRSLQETGSDFSVGSVRRFRENQVIRTVWARTVHQADRLQTTIDAFPNAMQDIIACNRMFRTQFWVDRVGDFRGHIAYEDHVPMLTAYVRATKFDILSRVTYNWRIREDRTSTGQQKAKLENLLDRIEVKEEAHRMLRAEASEFVYDLWVARAIEVDFPAFISHALTGEDVYRNILTAVYRTFFGRASGRALAEVRTYQKVRGWLIAQGRWDDLRLAEEYFREVGQLAPTVVRDGRIVAAFPEDNGFLGGMPPEVTELSPIETRFEGVLERIRWLDETRLELTGWALIRGLAVADRHPNTLAWLVEPVTGERVPVAVKPRFLPEATQWAAQQNAPVDGTGFTIEVDTEAFNKATQPISSMWYLHLQVSFDGVTREGSVHNKVPGSSAAKPFSKPTTVASVPGVVEPMFHPARGFAIRFVPARVPAEELSVIPGTRRAAGVFRVLETGRPAPRVVRATRRGETLSVTGRVSARSDGSYRFEIELPAGSTKNGGETRTDWDFQVVFPGGTDSQLGWPLDTPQVIGRRGAGAVNWQRGAGGNARMLSDAAGLEVSAVNVSDEAIEITVAHEGLSADQLDSAVLCNQRLRLSLLESRPVDKDRTTLRFNKRARNLGGPLLPAASGVYWLSVTTPDGTEVIGRCLQEFTSLLPVRTRDEMMNVRASITTNGQFRVHIAPPLSPEEQGATHQRTLQHRYQTRGMSPTDSVLFQCYKGEFATDSQLALDHGLRKARPDLTRYWAVRDYSTEIPERSVPVVIGTKAWYDVLASSRYLCHNIDFNGFFRKRPHQKYLQTFHGYPFKSMGISFWRGKGFTGEQIAHETARRNREWDAILVPSEMCADFYRTEYDYRGEILVTGYPRSDFPVNADRSKVRSQVLDRLGVSQDATVVLYAPTYRDNLTTRTYAAKRFDELDLDVLTRELGQDFVLLLRGHNNNQRELDRVLNLPNVVDVTDYPEVNELTVAADVAVLDYSSLRFDWALTRKPMLFFVPDVSSYFATRPPLFDYRSSAPGPLLSTTIEVVDGLRRLDEVASEFADEVERFNERFNQLHDGSATERVIDSFFS